MDPFIEGCGLWEDFHGHLIEKISEALADAVPPTYFVTNGERTYVVLDDSEDIKSHAFKPDVSIARERGAPTGVATAAVAESAIQTAPYSVRAFVEEEFRERFIEIREGNHFGQLVTSIEVLSPSNKKPKSPGWDLFQRKRQGLFAEHAANVVELDLLRSGQRMPMVDRLPTSPYRLLVARRTEMPYCQVWDAYFDRPLPPLPVPLAKPDADIRLDLQPMIDAIYLRWRYYRRFDYAEPLKPPLSPEELAWLEQRLRERTA